MPFVLPSFVRQKRHEQLHRASFTGRMVLGFVNLNSIAKISNAVGGMLWIIQRLYLLYLRVRILRPAYIYLQERELEK